jgi:hypothetical protein
LLASCCATNWPNTPAEEARRPSMMVSEPAGHDQRTMGVLVGGRAACHMYVHSCNPLQLCRT